MHLTNRWGVLALLFLVRCGMGFQFQAVPALAPDLMRQSALSLADIGLLIGLYQAPGIALALPGGALARAFGDKRIVAVGLALMVLGGLISMQASSLDIHLLGRLTAGVGGIIINVVLSKIVAEWFSGKELATAMALFINSWPVGIALGMLTYPLLAETGGLAVALGAVALYPLLTLVALLLLYQSPASLQPAGKKDSAFPQGAPLVATVIAGAVWGLYNVALGTIIGFVTLVLHEDGWQNLEANRAASLIMWIVALSVPLGGVLADRTQRNGAVILAGLAAFAVSLLAMTRMEPVMAFILVAGFVGGLPAGAIMGLAPTVLHGGTRSLGMGLFFTVFYLLQLVGPWLVGVAAESAGRTSLALDCGAVAAILACLGYVAFAALRKRIVLPGQDA